MVSLVLKGQVHIFTLTGQDFLGHLTMIQRSRSMSCNQLESINGCGGRRNRACVEAPEMTDHCFCPDMEVRMR